MTSEAQVLLFSGYNDRAIISFARTLRAKGVNFAVIARDHADLILRTDYSNEVIFVRDNPVLDRALISRVLDSARSSRGSDEYLIAPSTEALNRFLLKERAYIEGNGVTVPLVHEDLYAAISDKFAFTEICRSFGISVPMEYEAIGSAELPFVAKPRKFRADDGSINPPFLIFNREEQSAFLERCDDSQFFFQDYVGGKSIYLLYYFGKDGSVAKLSQENIVQQPAGKSILAAATSDFHNSPESVKYEALFKSLGFRGLVMVEIKVSGSEAFMIEANPRFWGPSQLFIDSGLNLFEEFLYDYELISERPYFGEVKAARYFWFGGLQAVRRDAGEIVCHTGTKEEFLAGVENWMSADVYQRKDTIKIFREESQ